jgi:hypothetical protein
MSGGDGMDFQYLSTCYQTRVGSYGYVLSR